MKLLIKNASIATSQEVLKGDLLAVDGKIVAVGQVENIMDACVIDATGKYLLPGGVDVHTHFDLDVGIARASDNWYTGSIAAAWGGTTSVVDHLAFGPAGCTLDHQVAVYHQLAKDAVIDYGFHSVVQHVDDSVERDMGVLLKEEGISSCKVYLTYDYRLSDYEILRVLQRARELGIVVCAHCENDGMISRLREQFLAAGKTTVRYHPLSRPPACEAEAVWRMLMLAKAAGDAHVYIVHLSTALGLEAIRTARRNGQKNIHAETCPQYLFLDDSRYNDDLTGLKYMMSPPLRKKENVEALWQGLQSGEIDVVATDHCPFFFATQKQQGGGDFSKTPCGVPGVEERLQLLFSYGFLKGRISLPQLVRLCCTTPAQIFGIAPQKGDITVGADADLVLFDPNASGIITKANLHENVDYTLYEGMPYHGAPVLTVSRGEIIVENGHFLGNSGRGRYLKRMPHQVR